MVAFKLTLLSLLPLALAAPLTLPTIPSLSLVLASSSSSATTYVSESSPLANAPGAIPLAREGTVDGFFFSCVTVDKSAGPVKDIAMTMVTGAECRFFASSDCSTAASPEVLVLRQDAGKEGATYIINSSLARDAPDSVLAANGVGSFVCAGWGDKLPAYLDV